ncbi:hypothetical protein U1Q18_011813 [Sarracenia purpurea var. burkii]
MSNWRRFAAGSLKRAAEATRSYQTIQAIPREVTGNRVSARERSQGRIPAVVFAQNPSDGASTARSVSRKNLVTAERQQILAILKSVQLPFFCSTTFPLQIRAGSGSSTLLEAGTVLPIKIHRNRETGKILNLVFAWANEGMQLKVDVPVVFKGEDVCPGLKKGGSLSRIRTTLKYICPAEHIPQKIEVDVGDLDIGDGVFMRDIEVHPSLKPLSKSENIPICKVVATKSEIPESARESPDLEVAVNAFA